MGTRTLTFQRALGAAAAAFALAALAGTFGAAQASAATVAPLAGGEPIVVVSSATELAAELNAGSDATPATGDDTTGIVTITGQCAGADGAGLDDIGITPSATLKGITFSDEGAGITMNAETSGALIVSFEPSSPSTFKISGTGTISGAGGGHTPLGLNSVTGEDEGTLVIGEGVTVQNTGGGVALTLVSCTCEIQQNARVASNSPVDATVWVGMDMDEYAVTSAALTIDGTVLNTAGPALSVNPGQCTVTDDGMVLCDTSGGQIGVAVGAFYSAEPIVSTLTLNGGEIIDQASGFHFTIPDMPGATLPGEGDTGTGDKGGHF